ncbi:MAG TPA: ABC transporter substrate-binding protein [Steroidobacteraceae bacterium]|jgi:phospholipid transport system substrate-binding protein|nr:ABC transporter substrate-binding protein [Steroidobacteraceae bacterium]
MPRLALLLCAFLLAPVVDSAYAAGSDPAVAQVRTLTASLLSAMRAGPAVSTAERYRKLQPVIRQVFALPLMTSLSVGPDWTSFRPQQQQALISAFSRYTIANYAHNFHSYDGQKFQVDGTAVSRADEKIVRSSLIPRDGTPSSLLYRMRNVNGTWKVIDVYYDGVSQLILHRTDFAAAIASGGAPALLAHLNKVSDDLMK